MAVTFTDAKQLSPDKFTGQVIDNFVASPVLATLPFDNTIFLNGSSMGYVYNAITTEASASTRALNAEYVPQEAVTSQVTTTLKVMGGSYQIDRVIARNMSNAVNQVALQSNEKAKGAVAEFHDLFINGDSSTNATQFDGLDKLARTTNKHIVDANGLDLSTGANIKANAHDLLFALRQVFKGTEGFTHMGMNSDMFAVFQSIADYLPNVSYSRDEMGNGVYHYGNTRIVGLGQKAGTYDEVIATDPATGTTSIYLWREGIDGVHGISPEGSNLVEVHTPDFNDAKAVHTGDVELVVAIVAKKNNSIGILENIKVLPLP